MRKIFLIAAAALAAAGILWAQEPSKKPVRTPFYTQRATLFDVLPVDSTNIVFLGNSITNGCEWHELLGMPNAINRGISGDIVDGIEERLTPVVVGHPAKIFLMIGVNDVSHNLSADSISHAILNLVDHIRLTTPSTKLYLQSCLPINNSFGKYKNIFGKEQVIRDINDILACNSEAHGATWINLYPAFADDEGNLKPEYTNDGLHLLGSGYLLWRELLRPYLED